MVRRFPEGESAIKINQSGVLIQAGQWRVVKETI